jgi:hypothetical protein
MFAHDLNIIEREYTFASGLSFLMPLPRDQHHIARLCVLQGDCDGLPAIKLYGVLRLTGSLKPGKDIFYDLLRIFTPGII